MTRHLTVWQTVVTCISTLNKSHPEEGSVACLVLGTESSSIFILGSRQA